MSGRDIRRLVAQASVFPNAEKTNMALRLISAAGVLGVGTVLMSTDTMGVAAGVLRARDHRRSSAGRWPELVFVEPPVLRGTAEDTRDLVAAMRDAGASVIVVLGGDGTVRAASATCGDTPLLPLSTGTNNAFPQMWEATVAGTAAGLLATGRVDVDEATYRAKVLHVTAGATTERALVDVCVSTQSHVGSKALWQPATLRELYCAFAEPHAIGLSSVAGLLVPTGRRDPHGVAIRFGVDPAVAPTSVVAPIAPGVLATLAVETAGPLLVGERVGSAVPRGTVAVDGERELEFGPSSPVGVELSADGPLVVDVRAALAVAAHRGLLVTGIDTRERV
ncbi:MAG: NAD(+)/NADH kinase [Actinomycetota bacterium]|nr:NAD(+)/NADH kinase [Actinomycetota bacterium]